MSRHEKEIEQEDAFITPSLHLCVVSSLARKARGVGSNPTARAELFLVSFLSTFLPLLLTYALHPSFSLPGVRSGARQRIIKLKREEKKTN